MIVTALIALAMAIVVGLCAWETWADIVDARREIDLLRAQVDRDEYVIAELRRRIGELNEESD